MEEAVEALSREDALCRLMWIVGAKQIASRLT